MKYSMERRRECGYIDVYVYLYAPVETKVKEMRREAEGWCIERRFIPHYILDTDRSKIRDLMYLGKVEKYEYMVIYSPENVGEDVINILFTIGMRGVKNFISMDGWEFPPMILSLINRQKDINKDKIHAGRLKKAKEGIYIGSTPPFGYKRSKNKDELALDFYEAFVVRYIFYRREQGFGYKSIASELNRRGFTNRFGNPFNHIVILNIVKKKDFYRGYLEQEGIKAKGKYTPLLTEDGKVDMSYIGNKFDVEEEEKEAKRAKKRKRTPHFIKPARRDGNGVITSI